MMKKVFCFICVLFSFAVFAQLTYAENFRTTASEILFNGIEWGTEKTKVIRIMNGNFHVTYKAKTTYPYKEDYFDTYIYKTSSFSDALRRVFPYYTSEDIESEKVTLRVKDKVAGYNIDSIDLCFLKVEGYGFYKAKYHFSYKENELYTQKEQYEDLKEKLTSIYGEPYEYSETDSRYAGYKYAYSCCVWIGEKQSGISLEYCKNLTGMFAGSESVTIEYGTASVNNLFEEILNEENEVKNRQLDELHANKDGL